MNDLPPCPACDKMRALLTEAEIERIRLHQLVGHWQKRHDLKESLIDELRAEKENWQRMFMEYTEVERKLRAALCANDKRVTVGGTELYWKNPYD